MLNTRPSEINAFGFIYAIINHVNGKRYIGQTTQTLNQRFKKHRFDSRNPATLKKKIQILYHSMKKHGEDKFSIELLATAYSREELDSLECGFIEEFKTLNKSSGYNIRSGGKSGGYPTGYGQRKEHMRPRVISDYGRGILREVGRKNLKNVDREKNIRATKLALTGKKKDPESIERGSKKRRVKVIATHLVTKEETAFEGVRIAARALNLDISMISKVCKGKHKYYKEWTFRYG